MDRGLADRFATAFAGSPHSAPGEDPDVSLDLQLAVTAVYDLLGYDLAVDYARAPEVPLSPEEMTWAEERLRFAGVRS